MNLIKEKMKKAVKDFSWFKVIVLALLIVFSILFVYLLYWAIITSFKMNRQDFRINPLGLPKEWITENYRLVVKEFGPLITIKGVQQKVGVAKMVFHSLFFSVGCAVIATLVPCLMAYIVVRFPCTMSKIYYGIVIVTMILPIVGAYPAEIQMFHKLGIDAVGMSTVVEAIAAHHMGLKICCISFISNLAAGMNPNPLTHEEVQEAANEAAPRFKKLVTEAVKKFGEKCI